MLPLSAKAAGKARAASNDTPVLPLSAKAAGKARMAPAAQEQSRKRQRSKRSAGTLNIEAQAVPEDVHVDGNAEADAVDVEAEEGDAEDEVEATGAGGASSKARAAGRKTGARDDDDAEVSYVQHSGDLALVDFPHARQNCASHPFVAGRESRHCSNCYCFVCDSPVSVCRSWREHCHATHESAEWRARRDAARAAANAASAAAAADRSSSIAPSHVQIAPVVTAPRWSCDELLEKAQQVYPRETPEPPGLVAGTTLRPYQKQSIAFMLDVERSNDPKGEGRVHHPGVQEASVVRGGWLADEVGMGKTMVVTCCVLAEPAKDLKTIKDTTFASWLAAVRSPPKSEAGEGDQDDEDQDEDEDDKYKDETEPTLSFGLTLIVVNNTLVQQWDDELRKFAPSLVVHKFYASSTLKEAAIQNLRKADVLLTTPHMIGYTHGLTRRMLRHMRVHRLVVDESHLIAERGGRNISSRLRLISTSRTWLVSGTPFSTSLDQLEKQSMLLGSSNSQGEPDLRRLGLGQGTGGHRSPKLSNEAIVDWLRTRLIRHTKRMRIGGDVALALPDADCRTVWLEMSEDERLLYGIHECASGHTMKLDQDPSQKPGEGGKYTSALAAAARRRDAQQGPDHAQRGARYAAAAHVYDEHVVAGNPLGELYYNKYSLDKPSTQGKFHEAVAAYKRTFDEVRVPTTTPAGVPQRFKTELVAKASLTKYAALLDDLAKLREEEPSFRAVVFTRFDVVQQRLVRLLKDAANSQTGKLGLGGVSAAAAAAAGDDVGKSSKAAAKASAAKANKEAKLQVYEFNKTTAPTSRHRRISEFQNSTAPNPRVFVVTYATAAVGITLTAATRVYLMEPCPDPAQEVQAAGRIHRLGQTRDIFIVRYAFRDSIEAATCALHDKIKSGEIVVRDGKFPVLAHELFRAFGPSGKLFQRCGEDGAKVSSGTGLIDWQGQKQPPRRKPGVPPKFSKWTRACSEEECVLCGAKRLAPGSSTWSGTGIYSYLNNEPHKHADPPVAGSGVGVFGPVPKPPDKWMPERFAARNFLALVNTRAEREVALEKLEEEERRNPAGNAGGLSGSQRGTRSSSAAIDVDDEEGEEGNGEARGSGAAGADSSSARAGFFDIMLSDEGEDYAPGSQDEDCTEGATDELASDDNAEQLKGLARVNENGIQTHDVRSYGWTYQNGGPQYSMPKLTGLPRHPTAKNISEFASSRFDHSSLRIPRGSKCAPPPSAEELGSDADDEEEPPDESEEEKDDEEEMSEDEQLYSDFFCEACRDDDGLERDVLHGDGGGADGVADDEFYGGRHGQVPSNRRSWYAGDSDESSYDGYDSDRGGYDSDGMFRGYGDYDSDEDDYW